MSRPHDAAHWAEYNAAQGEREVRPLCREVMGLAGAGRGRTAVDLGCGRGRETDALLRDGWRVHALDGGPGTVELVTGATRAADRERLAVRVVPFAELGELPPADLVYAGYALPYAHPEDFPRVWGAIRAALRPGGWLAVNLFGVRDSWADNAHYTFLTRDRVEAMLDGLTVRKLVETDEPGNGFCGPKHWHAFDVIARVPA